MRLLTLNDIDVAHKKVLMRVDFNVPMHDGKISDDTRIRATLPGLQSLLARHAKIILLSHLGRPNEGEVDAQYSLAPVAEHLSTLLKQPVHFCKEWLSGVDVPDGAIALCENVRFQVGENKDNAALAQKMASLCDIFVMDAFATAHRAQASTHGVMQYAPVVCAGPLLLAEVTALTQALQNPKKPLLAIVGGSKVSTKLTILQSLLLKVDQLIVGGGIANTFLAAQGYAIGQSLYEKDLLDTAKDLLDYAEQRQAQIILPSDVVVAQEISANANATTKPIEEISANDKILDLGRNTCQQLRSLINQANTIIWNGPVGVFEYEPFSHGTETIALAVAESPAFSLAGGGDTIAAIMKFNVANNISYISTAGGAFLEFIEGKTLPAIAMLQQRTETFTQRSF